MKNTIVTIVVILCLLFIVLPNLQFDRGEVNILNAKKQKKYDKIEPTVSVS